MSLVPDLHRCGGGDQLIIVALNVLTGYAPVWWWWTAYHDIILAVTDEEDERGIKEIVIE
ncbi:hypothetical protein L195_g054928 [Trifolium pratense]|uniref:Uncharacterized protein n=1 Tax=Trifolium pratense TaxID=57577 RepID=A0A2K3KIQ6_TRIPR|nr:hypothetical protein L195_g054928 [Trifolium pratense]